MSNLLTLVRLQTRTLFMSSTRAMRRSRRRVGMGILVLQALMFMYLSATYAFSMVMVFQQLDRDLALYMMCMLTFILLVVFSFYNCGTHLFGSRDYDLLRSLPISSGALVASKLLSLMVVQYFYTLFLLVPGLVVFGLLTSQGLVYIVGCIGLFLLFPCISVVLSALISLVVGYVSSRFKYKNLISNLLMIVILIGVFVGSFSLQSLISGNVSSLAEMKRNFLLFMPFCSLLIKGMLEGNWLAYLLGCVINLIPFVAFSWVFARFYSTINTQMKNSYHEKNFKLKKMKVSGSFHALFIKELRRFFACGIYVMNTIFGPVLMLGAGIFALFSKASITEMLSVFPSDFPFSISGMLAILLIAVTMISCTTNSSISLEGTKLWLTKTLPIRTEDIFAAKMAVNLVILIPGAVGSAILMGIACSLSLAEIVLLSVLACLTSLFTAACGLCVNLSFPRFDWFSESMVVKQSMSVMLRIFGGLLLSGAVGFVSFQLLMVMASWTYLLVLNGFFLLLDLLALLYLKRIGVRQFKAL